MTCRTASVAFCLLACLGIRAGAQTRRDGRLLVTVTDPSGAVIPNATVTVSGLDAAGKAVAIAPVQTSGQGLASFGGLVPGRYSIVAEFAGFDLGLLRDVRVRAGDNKHVVVLPLPRVLDAVDVGQDAQTAASDRSSTFGTTLTREQMDALSDDPAEMQRQLQDMAGAGAVIRVDSFEGAQLPPKSQIKAIHVTRDAFAAENHNIEGIIVDIITQPGIGPVRGATTIRYRNGALSGISPFNTTKGPEQIQNYNFNVGGSLFKQKSSFAIYTSVLSSYDTANLNAALPAGTRTQPAPIKTWRDSVFFYGNLDYALTKDQTLRLFLSQTRNNNRNLGIGTYDLSERAYSIDDLNRTFRLQEAGPLGRRFFTNTRLQVVYNTTGSHSLLEAPTIRILDASTRGGGQVAGTRSGTTVSLGSDFDYVRGKQSVRTGVQLDGLRLKSDETSNYLGTYTFEDLDAFDAGRPRSYTKRIGDPHIAYWNLQAAVYVQDDIRARRGLTLSPGLRYEIQTHLSQLSGFGPRFGVTWSPLKSGKTTLRTSIGTFYGYLPANVYEQTLRVNGFNQQELNIIDPSYPDPGSVGTVPATNRYLLGDGVQMSRLTRVSAGVDEAFTPKIRVGWTYTYVRGSDLLRGENLNAPADGVRPDPAFSNIIEVVSDARQRTNGLNTTFVINQQNIGPMQTIAGSRFDWKRTMFSGNYNFSRFQNNTDGAFATPATGNLADDWGPGPGDARHRVNLSVNTTAIKPFSVNVTLNMVSGTPYTELTGSDDDGDLIFNDRPAGVGRNTLRGDGQRTVNLFVNYILRFGRRDGGALPPGVVITRAGEGVPVNVQSVAQDNSRFHMTLGVQALNLTNHANYTNYSGRRTSPFYGQPTQVLNTRKVEFLLNLQF